MGRGSAGKEVETTSELNELIQAVLRNEIVIGRILSFLRSGDLKNSRAVCRFWRVAARDVLKKQTLFRISRLEKAYKVENDCFSGSDPELFYKVWVVNSHSNEIIGIQTWPELIYTNITIQNGLAFQLCEQIRSLMIMSYALEELVQGINKGDFPNLKIIDLYYAADDAKGLFTRAALPSLETLFITGSSLESNHPFYQGLLETAPNLTKLHTCVFLNLEFARKLRFLSLNNDPAGRFREMLSTVNTLTLKHLYLRNQFTGNALSMLPNLKVLEMGEMKIWDSGKSWNPELEMNCPKLEVLFWLYPQAYIESSPPSLKRLELCCCGLDRQNEKHDWMNLVCKHLSQHYPQLPLFVVAKNCRLEDSSRHENNKSGFQETRKLYEAIINTDVRNISIKTGLGHSLPKLMYILDGVSVLSRSQTQGIIEFKSRLIACCQDDCNWDSYIWVLAPVVQKLLMRFRKVVFRHYEVKEEWLTWLNQQILKNPGQLEVFCLPVPSGKTYSQECPRSREKSLLQPYNCPIKSLNKD